METLMANSHPQLSILIPAKDAAGFLGAKVSELHEYLTSQFPASFEIIVVPNGPETKELGDTVEAAQALTLAFSNVRYVHYRGLRGKAAALRAGFDVARGSHVAFIDADLPFNLDFFNQAFCEVTKGADIVSANRRVEQSVFVVPVPLLPLVYKRHWAGLAFNRLVRLALPIRTLDTQAGLKYMSRNFAEKVFTRQLCTGFLLDVELFLIASITKAKHVELPVELHLYSEKSTVRLAKELSRMLIDMGLIWLRYRAGEYNDVDHTVADSWINNNLLTSDDWGISPGVNEGILELARRGIVRRVSMMANGTYLTHKLDELKQINNISLGLHFNLTHGKPLPTEISVASSVLLYQKACGEWFYLRPLQLFWRTLFSLKQKNEVRAQIAHAFESQLAYLRSLGLKIDYFDSHHHVHLLPAVLRVIAPLAQKSLRHSRLVLDFSILCSKKFPLVLLSLYARRLFVRNQINYLKCCYPKYSYFVFPSRLRKKVNGLKNYEIIAHPAKYADLHTIPSPDLYNAQRVREYWTLLNISPR